MGFGSSRAPAKSDLSHRSVRGGRLRYGHAEAGINLAAGVPWSRDSQELAQRFRITMAKDGRAMQGEGTMKKEGAGWEPDLRLSYVRAVRDD